MTTPWMITPVWAGATVAILASGPSMSQSVADELRKHRCIAVNDTLCLAPWADMLLSLDLNMQRWFDAREFQGIRVSGVACDDVTALYAGQFYERVEIAPGHVVEIHNTGLAAIRIAAKLGAAKIILAGFDPETPGYFDGHPRSDQRASNKYIGVAAGLKAIVSELRAQGIEVEYFTSTFAAAPSDDAPDPVVAKPAPRPRRGRGRAA